MIWAIYALAAIIILIIILSKRNKPEKKKEKQCDYILVRFYDGVEDARKQWIHRKHGGYVVRDIRYGAYVVSVPANQLWDKVKVYDKENVVKYAGPVIWQRAFDRY